MSDNTQLNTGTGGDIIRTEDLGGSVKLPISKIYVGGTNVDGGPVTSTNPFPIGGSDYGSTGIAHSGSKPRSLATDHYGRAVLSASDMLNRLHVESSVPILLGYAAYQADVDRFSAVTATGGTVTYNAPTGEYIVAVTATNASSAVHITNATGIYRPNHQMSAIITGNLTTTAPVNQRIEWGVTSALASGLSTGDAFGFCFDNSQSGTGVLCIFYRSSIAGGPNVTTRQSNWNVDTMDGSGSTSNPSGYNLDSAAVLNIQYYRLAVVWLGAWGIAWWVGKRMVHFVPFDDPAFQIVDPFARIPHLRLYTSARNTGASTINSFSYNCGVIETHGGGSTIISPYAFQNLVQSAALATNAVLGVVTLRAAATFGGFTNGRRIFPKSVTVSVAGGAATIAVWYGPASAFTLTGASFSAPTHATGSSAEIDTTSTALAVGAGADLIDGGALLAAGSLTFDLTTYFPSSELARSIGVRGDGSQTYLAVAVTSNHPSITTNANILKWEEYG